jgi:hypothetical protein
METCKCVRVIGNFSNTFKFHLLRLSDHSTGTCGFPSEFILKITD